MAWLRLDDGYTKHPKFEGWTVVQRWAWLEVMEYCARYSTGGRIPSDLSLMPRSTTPALLHKALDSGWIDVREDGSRWVHDWEIYNPSEALEERVLKALAENPDASANEIVAIVGGRRKAILALVQRFRSGSPSGSASGSAVVPDSEESGSVEPPPEPVPELVPRAPARTTRPVPSPEEELSVHPSGGPQTGRTDGAEDEELEPTLGPTGGPVDRRPGSAVELLERLTREEVR